MGSEIDCKKESKLKNKENREVLDQISLIDSENNILKNDDILTNKIKYRKIYNLEDDFQSALIQGIKNINSNLISLNEKNNEIKIKSNENFERNNFF
jgi:hypothetical protein